MGKIKLDVILVKYRGLVISFSILLLSILISILLFALVPAIKSKPVYPEYTAEEVYLQSTFSILDFELPDYTNRFDAPAVYYKRPVLKQWDKAQQEKFRIPVKDILLEMMEKEHIKAIQVIFSGLD